MIRERSNKNKTTEDRTSIDKDADVKQEVIPQRTSEQLHSFHEQAIQVLNILDSQGIDIYDTTRTPGMYLHQRNGSYKTINQSTIGKILHQSTDNGSSVSSKSSGNSHKENISNQQKQSSNIIDFLSKK